MNIQDKGKADVTFIFFSVSFLYHLGSRHQMQKIKEWSQLYHIPQRTLTQLLGDTDKSAGLRSDCRLAHQILHKNSELVFGFLSSLPPPKKQREGKMALRLDFLYPSHEGWRQVFEGFVPPYHAFSGKGEVSSLYLRSDGLELYVGETLKGRDGRQRMNLPTYIQAVGLYPEGYQSLTKGWTPTFLSEEFFIYGFTLGKVYSEVRSVMKFEHESIGVVDHALWYSCKNGLYNVSARLGYENLPRLWTLKKKLGIEQKVKSLNQKFFRRKDKKKIS